MSVAIPRAKSEVTIHHEGTKDTKERSFGFGSLTAKSAKGRISPKF